jgi:hypothetical protein
MQTKHINKIIKEGYIETLNYIIFECEKRNILPKYVKNCKRILKELEG